MYEIADNEFQRIAKEIFEKHEEDLELTVNPVQVMFLRTDRKKENAYAYCKRIHGEYELLTEKKYFIVIVSENFDTLRTADEKKYVILHELKHLYYDCRKDKYKLIDHSIKDFHQLLLNPKWNLSLVEEKK